MHSDWLDEDYFGVTVLYLGKVTLYIMCHATPDIIAGIYVPSVTDRINALTKVCTKSEAGLGGVSLFHIISP